MKEHDVSHILGVRFYSILFCIIFFILKKNYLHISIIQYQVKSGKLFRKYIESSRNTDKHLVNNNQ